MKRKHDFPTRPAACLLPLVARNAAAATPGAGALAECGFPWVEIKNGGRSQRYHD